MDLQLRDRVILVVGGHGLIGSAVVRQLTEEGAIAVAASRRAADGLVMDAADDTSVESAIARIIETHGRLDGVVVAAAPSARTMDPSKNSDPGQVRDAVEGKALTFLRVANAALGHMRDRGYGRIVGVSGQNAYVTGNIAGSVRNAALIITAKHLADEAAGTGITVNVVNPGIVTDDPSPDVPAGGSGQSTPADTARLVTFLLSPLSGTVSGESIAVGHRTRGFIKL
ncbi:MULTISPECIES: SDR family NAD(P)-dependent oxidoreductase [unclassified Microbacterium]|uniref:SDR family NAD(P)-dependent oxidoreductase n=1 Tax=unclassified Microbacterium TaxID=2609290 RepID=UPI000C2C5F5D|nr:MULTISPECIES: SDR family oxidoreductase [unclassified Microbacterium]